MKRGGGPWHQTKMTDPERAERLWLAIAVATLWVVSVGGESPSKEFGDLAPDAYRSPIGYRTFPSAYAQLFRSWDDDHCRNVDSRRWSRVGPLSTRTLAGNAPRSQKEVYQGFGSCISGGNFMKKPTSESHLMPHHLRSPSMVCQSPLLNPLALTWSQLHKRSQRLLASLFSIPSASVSPLD